MTDLSTRQNAFSLVVINAGTSDPSTTRMLADRVAGRVAALAAERGERVTVSVVDLREIATEVSTALVSQLTGPGLEKAIAALGQADGIVAATPVYMAGASGLFTSFFDVLDKDLIIRPSRWCWRPPPARPGTPSWWTSRCVPCLPTCGR